jgi:hypothetical protein
VGFGAQWLPHGRVASTTRVAYRFGGWPRRATLYAHYVRQLGGGHVKQVAVRRIGTVQGPCGVLTAKLRRLPADIPNPGSRLLVQYDTVPGGYRARHAPYVQDRIGAARSGGRLVTTERVVRKDAGRE